MVEKFTPISLLFLVFLLLAIFEKLGVLRAHSHLVLLELKDFRDEKNMHSFEWQDACTLKFLIHSQLQIKDAVCFAETNWLKKWEKSLWITY